METKIEKVSSHPISETLRIIKSRGVIRGKFNMISYRDKKTKESIIYVPSFDAKGYGATEEKAKEILKFCLDDYFKMLTDMPVIQMEQVLMRSGWEKKKINAKEFSKAYNGFGEKLENLNPVAEEIEAGVLSYY